MASILGVGSGLTAWARDLVAHGGLACRARRENNATRGIVRYGEVKEGALLAGSSRALVLGAPDEVAHAAVAGFVAESSAAGAPTVVIAEDAGALFGALALAGCPGPTMADAAQSVYEPLARLSTDDASELMAGALSLMGDAPREGGAYLGALARVLAHKGSSVTVRMIEACPHNRMHEVIDRLELRGAIDAAEAADLRACLDVPPACRSFIQEFFHEAVIEGALLAPEGSTVPTVSVMETVRSDAPHTLVLGVGSCQARALLAFVFAEIGACLRRHLPLSVVLCARSVVGWDSLGSVLRCAPEARWALISGEALEFFSGEEELRRWTASSERALCFAQGHASAELVSAVFGEYDKVDISHTRSRSSAFGAFGINRSDGRSVTRSIRRERVVKPEELRTLGEGEFFLLQAGQSGAGVGKAVR